MIYESNIPKNFLNSYQLSSYYIKNKSYYVKNVREHVNSLERGIEAMAAALRHHKLLINNNFFQKSV